MRNKKQVSIVLAVAMLLGMNTSVFAANVSGSDLTSTVVISDSDKPVVSDSDKPVVSDSDKPVVSDSDKPVVSDSDKPVVSDSDKPVVSGSDEPDPAPVLKDYYNVTTNATIGGMVSAPRSVRVHGTATVRVTPSYGYKVASAKVNGKDVEVVNNKITIKDVTEDINVSVEFAKLAKYNVKVSASDGGVVVANKTVKENDMLVARVSPNRGYKVASAKVNGEDVPVIFNRIYVANVTEDVNVEVEFAPIFTTYNVKVSASDGGVVVANKTVKKNAMLVARVSPNRGYKVTSAKVNGENVPVIFNRIYVANVTEDVNIEVEFAPIFTTYNVKVSASDGGKVYGNKTVKAHESAVIRVSPNRGYTIASATVNGEDVPVIFNRIYVFNITEDVVVDVRFEKIG